MNYKNEQLSLEQSVGQRLMIGFDGLMLDDELKFYIREVKVGGLMLFSRNIDSPDQVADLCHAVQAYAAEQGQPPLLIGIDQEGGVVARLKPPFTQFPGNPQMAGVDEAEAFAITTAKELARIGVNINMAPVLDVADPQGESVMRQRVFGRDPRWVAEMGLTVIRHLQSAGILAVAKHFPGIGRTVLDSHDDLPDLDIDLETLSGSDLIPFKAAVDGGVTAVMLSHIRYTGLDPDWPASMSDIIAHGMLRRHLGFDGLVLTDDIDMGALAKHYDLATIVRRCLMADVDIILICHPGPKIQSAFELIRRHIDALEEAPAAGDRSVRRILRLKRPLSST